MTKEQAGRAEPPPSEPPRECVIGEYCDVHGFVHGAEAEELRERFEKLITEADHEGRLDADEIQRVLDDVDARDTLAYAEARQKMETEEERAEPPPVSPSGWQPMETAPKDGTVVALYCGWRFDTGVYIPPERRWVHPWDHREIEHPTHWMPLPDSPAARDRSTPVPAKD